MAATPATSPLASPAGGDIGGLDAVHGAALAVISERLDNIEAHLSSLNTFAAELTDQLNALAGTRFGAALRAMAARPPRGR